jgi:hypothetical protein
MSGKELGEWMAWCGIRGDLEPRRGDVRAAVVAQIVAATKFKGTKRKDFLPYEHLADKKELSPDDAFEMLKTSFRAVPKKVEKKK